MANIRARVTTLLLLNEVSFLLGFSGYLQQSSHRGFRLGVTFVRVLLLWLSIIALKWSVGQYVFLAAAALFALEYFAAFFRKAEGDVENVVLCYLVSHFSIVNFVIDRPGAIVGSPFSFAVALVNVAATVYSVVYLTVAFDFNAAWGCYGPAADWNDLWGGYCSTYKDADTAGFGCLHCIDALTSGDLEAYHYCKPGAAPLNLSGYFHTLVSFLSISMGVYIGSIPWKLKALVQQVKAGDDKKEL